MSNHILPPLFARAILLLSVVAVMGGCDGHMRVLYLRESQADTPQYQPNTRIIETRESKDVLSVVEHTAAESELAPGNDVKNTWRAEGFTLRAMQESDGLWRIEMLDWPGFMRSDLSRAVENRIVKQIRKR